MPNSEARVIVHLNVNQVILCRELIDAALDEVKPLTGDRINPVKRSAARSRQGQLLALRENF